jgi:cell division protein FtsI/penicillin-binding protein 2
MMAVISDISQKKKLILPCIVSLLLCGLAFAQSRKNPADAASELGAAAFDALENHAGAVMVMDTVSGRIVKRISRGMDVQFETSPFALAQIVTAYAALDHRIINEKTLLPCNAVDGAAGKVSVVEALASSCPLFFEELGRRLTAAQFIRAAAQIGFTYHSIENPATDAVTVRPIYTTIAVPENQEQINALTSVGRGMLARDLHFSQLVLTLATGQSPAERLSTTITVKTGTAVPVRASLNRAAVAVIRQGMQKSVDDGEAKAAASIDARVAARISSGEIHGERQALCISYAPANAPEIALVVFLKDATGREAAAVTGKLYEKWFSLKR